MAAIRIALGNAPRHCVAVCCLLAGCAPAPATQNDAGSDGPEDAAVTEPVDAAGSTPDAASPAPDAAIPAPDAAHVADAGGGPDAGANPDAGPLPDGGIVAHRHTIDIDGDNDFDPIAESFGTTSASYGAYVTWDDDKLYVGYSGADIGSGDPNKWLLVHIDTDPGTGTGASAGEVYNTQQPGFPAGFGAEYYFRWRASDDFQGLMAFADDEWSASGATITKARIDTYIEVAIPLSALGSPTHFGVTALMLNETPLAEGSYAGLYPDSFTDGYYAADTAPIPASAYLDVDLTSAAPPTAAANKKP